MGWSYGKEESKDYEEYLVVKMPLYLILCSRSLVILKVHAWRIGLEVLSPIIYIVHKSISTCIFLMASRLRYHAMPRNDRFNFLEFAPSEYPVLRALQTHRES
jgi:hypothetical protein